MTIDVDGLEDLPKAANQLIEFAGDDRIWLFEGEMGAGKTTFIKEVCKSLGSDDNVSSPTFSLVNEYLGKDNSLLYHFDFYRIEELQEALDIGAEEYLDSGSHCLIEWASNIRPLLPRKHVVVDIAVSGIDKRTFRLSRNE